MSFDEDFFRELPVGFVKTSLDGIIISGNEWAARLVGCAPEDISGRPVTDFYFDPEERQVLLSRILAGADSVTPYEFRVKRLDGKPVWVWAAIRAQRDAEGRPMELHVVFGESLQVPRAIQRFEKTLERHRRLNEILYQAVKASTVQEYLEYVGDVLREVLQADMVAIRVERQPGAPLLVGWPGRFVTQLPTEALQGTLAVSDCTRVAQTEEPLAGFCRDLASAGILSVMVVRAEGAEPVDSSSASSSPSVLLLVGNSAVRSWLDEEVGYAQTIGLQVAGAVDRLALLDETARQADFLNGILELAPAGILVLAQDMTVLRANNRAREILLSVDPAWQKKMVLPDPFVHPLSRFQDASAREASPLSVHVAGNVFEVSARPLDTGREARGLVAVLLDVTERERIRHLAESQDRLAALGRFAAGIAHDFNNLLTGIVGYAQLSLQEDGLPDSVRENLAVIAKQGRRAAKLVRQITDYSRRSVLSKQVLDLSQVVRDTSALMSRTLSETLRIETRILPGACMVDADRGRMEQVLTNLVLNASDAVQGSGLVRITLDVRDRDGDEYSEGAASSGPWAYLAVEDDGAGIPQEIRSNVFEPFFTTKPPGQGTGLGLSQVYGIVRQHGGHVEIGESDLGGAAVLVWLPLVHGDGVPRDSIRDSSDVMAYVPRGDGKRILLVEDDGAVRRAMERMAQSLGYDVLVSGSVDEAIQVLEGLDYALDLVLSDVVMPGRSGLELAQAVASRAPGLPVVMVTGYPIHREEAPALAESIVGWIQKPLDVVRLGAALAEALDRKPG